MKTSLPGFINDCARTAYAEPDSAPIHEHLTGEMLPKVLSFLPLHRPHVLDIGCGNGIALKLFRERGCLVEGVTINELERAACAEKGFIVNDAEMHHFCDRARSGKIDLIWARHVLEHSPIPFFLLVNFYRMMCPGGILFVEVPAPGTCCQHESNPNHYSVLGARAWARLIERAGFQWVMHPNEANNGALAPAIFERPVSTECGPDTYFQFIARKP